MRLIGTIRRRAGVYGAFAAMVPKMFLAYSIWVWMQFIVQVMAMVIFVAFWRAIYAGQETISGLSLEQTLNYILLAQIFSPVVHGSGVIYDFGRLLREGEMAIALLRPVDFQGAKYVNTVAEIVLGLIVQLPLALIAVLFFGLRVTADPLLWLAFLASLILGQAILFFFDWIIGCVSFYSTETWGLSVTRFAIGTFLSGLLVPLAMMPGWLQTIAVSLPFAQALYIPLALLTGITPLADMPRIWVLQVVYLVVLGVASRLVFRVAVRKVTVQGG
jgi:ABC-2 type transport system permease protein